MKLFDVYPLNPIHVVKAKGSYVFDEKGHRYLDMYGGHAVISIGHSHEVWANRLKEQIDQIVFYSNSVIIDLQEELADKLGKISGKNEYQLFLCNSGAEANENAFKLASFHTGRKKIVAFKNGFHGRTSLAVAATDNPSIVAPVNETDNVDFLPFNDVQALTDYFKQHGDKVSSVITEGIQGVGGIIAASNEFLVAIRQLCDQYGAVYIADSIQCGCGRTGQYYAHDIAGVDADIYTMAKGIGNGYPIGAVAIAPHLKPKHGMLGTTFGGNYLACAAAIAVIDVMQDEQLINNAAHLGTHIMAKLKANPFVKTVRGRGLMIGFEPTEACLDMRSQLLNAQSVFTGTAKPNVIRLLPSLALTQHEVDEFFEALDGVTSEVKI